jgi:hypothetical protein
MAGLMMMKPDPEKQYCRVKNAKRGAAELSTDEYLMVGFLSRGNHR